MGLRPFYVVEQLLYMREFLEERPTTCYYTVRYCIIFDWLRLWKGISGCAKMWGRGPLADRGTARVMLEEVRRGSEMVAFYAASMSLILSRVCLIEETMNCSFRRGWFLSYCALAFSSRLIRISRIRPSLYSSLLLRPESYSDSIVWWWAHGLSSPG